MSRYKDKQLSPWRVLLALMIVAGLGVSGFFSVRRWNMYQSAAAQAPWFASYVDVTAMPSFAFEQLGTTSTKDVVLSFIVAAHDNPCSPAWGKTYSLDQANVSLDLDRRIARLRQQGGQIAVSFGGLKNDELAVACTDRAQLKKAYELVINRYDINTIDLDLELTGLSDPEAARRRAEVLGNIQRERRASGKSLAIWVTLPVAPQGLTTDGTNAITWLLEGGVDLAGINVMTMNYGESLTDGMSVLEGSKRALAETHRQLGVLYQRAGVQLSEATVWSKIGATPMIGQNDVTHEVFSLEAATALNKFAQEKGVGRLSMWSANRDVPCGGNYVNTKVVSDSCSGITQDKFAFTTLLSGGFEGRISDSASVITTHDPTAIPEIIEDDPATSPYQIWKETGAYLQGTKVVWHGNVYEAKWWTQGDEPDNPVLQTWETPWKLIGPVLPGEKPLPQATLPEGTYPVWSGNTEYDTGQRVLFEGVPYQAKWWNKDQSPAAASSNADSSPWAPLTQAEINEILAATD